MAEGNIARNTLYVVILVVVSFAAGMFFASSRGGDTEQPTSEPDPLAIDFIWPVTGYDTWSADLNQSGDGYLVENGMPCTATPPDFQPRVIASDGAGEIIGTGSVAVKGTVGGVSGFPVRERDVDFYRDILEATRSDVTCNVAVRVPLARKADIYQLSGGPWPASGATYSHQELVASGLISGD